MDSESKSAFQAEKMPERDSGFYREMRQAGVRNLELCYQCTACSNGCPLAFAMDYYPHQLIHMIRLGLRESVLQSKTIWQCTSCHTCATRCPNQVDVVQVMDILCSKVIQEKMQSSSPAVARFHKTFIKEIQKKGRINELTLLARYKVMSGLSLFSFRKVCEEAGLGLILLKKGKFKLFMSQMNNKKAVKEVFKNIFATVKAPKKVDQ